MIGLPGILHGDTVTILATTGGLPDADGIPQTIVTEYPWPGVNVQQVAAEELTAGQRETATTVYRVAGSPPPVPIEAGDTIRWNGTDYEVDGAPDARTGPFRLNHTSLRMVASRG